ncbi:MAG: MBL fold metallo-hydrolase [Anaerolineales bacterium]
MTVWGIGPKLIGLTALYALPAVLAEFLWPSRFALHGVPSAVFLIAGGLLIAIGIPIWILASNDVDRAYDEGILATQGMYALCRHPIYGTAVCLVLPGVVLLFRSVWLLTIPVAAYLFCRLLLSNEEDHLRRTFGPAYRAYEKTVPALFPALWKIPNAFFYPIPTGKLDENVYAARDGDVDMFLYTDGRNTIAVDCGYSAKRIARELTNLSIDPAAITHLFLTHTDMDHAGGLELLPHAEVHLSAAEEQMIDGRTARLLGIFRNQPISRPHTALADGDTVTAGEIRVRAVATPGHTPGSMSFLVNDKVLFTGDALILRNGRVEAFYPLLCMNTETVKTSIRRLTALEGIVRLCTAHTGCSGAFREAMKRWRPAGELRETGK